ILSEPADRSLCRLIAPRLEAPSDLRLLEARVDVTNELAYFFDRGVHAARVARTDDAADGVGHGRPAHVDRVERGRAERAMLGNVVLGQVAEAREVFDAEHGRIALQRMEQALAFDEVWLVAREPRQDSTRVREEPHELRSVTHEGRER